MNKVIKLVGILAGLLIVIAIAAVVVITLVIDPNDYKEDIARAVRDGSGHELNIEGDLSLTFFPWFGIAIGKTELAGAPGFGAQPMVRVEQVNVRVKLLPLLSKKLEMDTVLLDGAAIHLVKNAQGKGNWVVDAPRQKQAEVEKKDGQKAGPGAAGTSLAGLEIKGVELRDARLVWEDRAADTHLVLNKVNLRTGHLRPAMPVDLGFDMDVEDKKAARSFHVGFSGKVTVDVEQQLLSVEQLKMTLADLQLSGNVKVTSLLGDERVVQAVIASNEFVPRDLANAFGIALPETRDPAVFGKAKMDMTLSYKADNLDITRLTVQLDDTGVQGRLSASNLASPAIDMALQLDEIDADRYLPPAPPRGEPATQADKAPVPTTNAGTRAAAAAEPELLPVETLRGLNIKGSLQVGKLKAYNLRSSQIEIGLSADKGKIRIHPAAARLYEGGYSGDVRVDVSGTTPIISMDEKLTGIEAEPLFLDLADLKWVTGKADMSARLTTRGNTMSALRKGLNGEINFSFLNGAIKGFNLMHSIRTVNAMLQGYPAPAEEVKQTDFAEMRGHALVKDGVVHNDTLVASSPLFQVNGKGSADLVQEQLDYHITTEITATLPGEVGRQLEKIKGTPIPVRISGSFYDLSIKPELDEVLKAKLKKKVEEKVQEKLEEKLQDKLGDQVQDKLKGLFGR